MRKAGTSAIVGIASGANPVGATCGTGLAGLASLVGLVLLPGRAAAQADDGSTTIEEVLLRGAETCVLEIAGEASVAACAGSTVAFSATLGCAEGSVPINDPVWLLDGVPLGSGLGIALAIPAGTHELVAHCGSCTDAVVLEGVDCSLQPRLDALWSHDAEEAETGVFLAQRAGPITPLTFGAERLAMRPFTLALPAGVDSGTVELTSVDEDVLQLFTEGGAAIALPSTWDATELPVTFLVHGAEFGQALLRATWFAPLRSGATGDGARAEADAPASRGESPQSDEIRVVVGPWPGLTGRSLAAFPHFLFADTVNDDDVLETALDPGRHPDRVGFPCDVYVVAHRAAAEWALDPTLVDVSGSVEGATLTAGSIADNIVVAWSSGLEAGPAVSRAYDVVYDFGRDGTLDPGDLIDGLVTADLPEGALAAGVSIVRDLALPGPYATLSSDYSGGTWLTARVYYPNTIGALGALPLVTIGHGNGHAYTWYDYLGTHLASHGYVVLSYRNDTGPGIETASTTTLTNLDYFLTHLGTIAGGVLQGHVDAGRIAWIGHSRGGEGVVRAYDRLFDGVWSPQGYARENVRVVASIAPTVYLAAADTDPHEVPYYLITGGADGDVTGRPDLPGDQSFRIADRSLGTARTTYVHGADHNDFNCCGFEDAEGPNLIGRAEAQRVAKSYFLALCHLHLRGDAATREYFTRMYDDLAPSGVAAHVEIAQTWREVGAASGFVVDDFQSAPTLDTSSSLGAVTSTVTNPHEGPSDDGNTSFTWLASDPMNGLTYASGSEDLARCLVFDHSVGTDRFLEFEVVPSARDLRAFALLSFRAAQGTRHPETVALAGPHSFAVTLRDEDGVTSTVPFGVWGALTPLYARTGAGSGVGWLAEMNTVRIPLACFSADGSGLDLSRIAALRFEFGASYGAERGRLALDDVQFLER